VTARNPTTFVVGAGPVATALAGALRLGGVPVLGLWARKPAAARAAGSIAGVAAFSSAPPDVLLESEVVILAVRDGVIGEVADMLLGTGLINKRHVMLHCAGSASATELLAGVSGRVNGVGTMHPLSAIADGKLAMRALKGTVFGLFIALVACHFGLRIKPDTESLGNETTNSVVASITLVILLDAVFAIVFRGVGLR